MSLINCKIHLELNWNNNCVMYGPDTYVGGDNANNRETTFKITSTELHLPIVTLSSKDNVNLTKQLNEGLMPKILKDFLLILLFKELIDSFFLLFTILMMVMTRLKETVIENISSQE